MPLADTNHWVDVSVGTLPAPLQVGLVIAFADPDRSPEAMHRQPFEFDLAPDVADGHAVPLGDMRNGVHRVVGGDYSLGTSCSRFRSPPRLLDTGRVHGGPMITDRSMRFSVVAK